jgi:hypothetical protein
MGLMVRHLVEQGIVGISGMSDRLQVAPAMFRYLALTPRIKSSPASNHCYATVSCPDAEVQARGLWRYLESTMHETFAGELMSTGTALGKLQIMIKI